MEKGPLTLGMEDGAIDVERLLVEPEVELVSMDSVCCFDEKISENAMDMEEFSGSFGRSGACVGQQGKNVLSEQVLDVIPSEVEVGYFQVQNEFCSMGEEYLLGVEFAESITNLDYSSILQTPVSDRPILASSADAQAPWKSDQSRIMEAPECQNNLLNIHSSKLSDIPTHHECKALAEKSLKSSSLSPSQNIGNFYDFSSCSYQDVLSNEIDGSLSPSREMNSSFKIEKDKEYGIMNESVVICRFQGNDSLPSISARGNYTETFPMQKRSRKPTQRFIDELSDPVTRYSKKRREVSSSTSKEKSVGVQVNKKCHMGSRATRLPAEETSVIAIQVPFGSLVHKEGPKSDACDMARSMDCGNSETKSKDNHVNHQNKKKMGYGNTAVHLNKRENFVKVANQKKMNEYGNEDHLKKKTDSVVAAGQKKRDNWVVGGVSPKKWDNPIISVNQKKVASRMSARRKKKVDFLASESRDEATGRRKHHRLWTISEVRKLIDGVSQFGVGSWSRIKKLFFSTSAHRTSVDLKDKWRNLLKASGIQDQSNHRGEKKRNVAWRPLPKSILHRVCELAVMYPYPKGPKPKLLQIHHDSPDKSSDITLSNYQRILRSMNGN